VSLSGFFTCGRNSLPNSSVTKPMAKPAKAKITMTWIRLTPPSARSMLIDVIALPQSWLVSLPRAV
jgi:hypothetical protein